MGGVLVSSILAHSVAAQTALSPADDVSRASTIVTAVVQINTQRQHVVASISDQLARIATQLRTIASAPLATDDQRSAALAQVQNVAAQVNQLSVLAVALNNVRNGEVVLLNLAKNYLLAAVRLL